MSDIEKIPELLGKLSEVVTVMDESKAEDAAMFANVIGLAHAESANIFRACLAFH